MHRSMADPIQFIVYEVTDSFVYGKILLSDMLSIAAEIEEEVAGLTIEPASIGNEDDDEEYPDVRSSKLAWLKDSTEALDKVAQVVNNVNCNVFNLDISDAPPEYQYTLYLNPNDHYDWHKDTYPEDLDEVDYTRTLSLSLCLSPAEMYEGAELFIQDGSECNIRVFKMQFGEFVIFPSTVEHRVNALRSGERASLVVWYGHNNPHFKAG